MGSGEGDAIRITVDTSTLPKQSEITTTNGFTNDWSQTSSPTWYYQYPYYNYYVTYPTTIYKYQVKCPKSGCKKFNWLELDVTTRCYNCGARLRAVSDVPDFNIPIQK